MLKLNSNDLKIYIISPYVKTGGPRSLHQLALTLQMKGLTSYVYYFDNAEAKEAIYDDIDVPVANCIEDKKNNMIIVPEMYAEYLLEYKNVKKVIWWLSLYFFKCNDLFWYTKAAIKRKGYSMLVYPIALIYYYIRNNSNFKNKKTFKKIEDNFDLFFHLYNCEYVKKYLAEKSVKNEQMSYLCGPLIKDYYRVDRELCITKKRNIVAINPSKVDRTILKLFKKGLKKMNIELIEIKNMTTKEVKQTLLESKIYVDLGYFPGPERMPREAVSLYCNIVTTKIGAANNNVDVPIPEKYKVSIKRSNISSIVKLVCKMIDDYEMNIPDFDKYRDKVYSQIENFDTDLDRAIALFNGESYEN